MTIITLTSDWQNDDFYIGAIKGLLYGKCKNINIVDITHKIQSFKHTQAAFILKNAYNYYPPGTIHIVGVNSNPTDKHPAICVKHKQQFFLGTASGVFNLMFTENPEKIVVINENQNIKKSSFPELTIFGEAAVFLANGGSIDDLGENQSERFRYNQFIPAWDEFDITGNVIYIDSYQNVITNIDRKLFSQVRKNRNFMITVKSDLYRIKKISTNYSEVESGDLLALFNSLNLLEIAMRNTRFAELADIKINSPVTVKFI